ncbi:hypothetical protein ACFSM5_08335 [Lacibacterium aquatile]|uniref:DUF2946 domain-containing protein n=1 Tax=Lacibacterium aquatile TaxID=1168082 RepID=A0ABW5DPD4_9PROT
MTRHRQMRKTLRNRSTLGRRIAAVFALLAVVLSAFAGPVAVAKPMDADRAAVIAMFGSNALCEPTDDGNPEAVAHINHCVLCTVQRVDAPTPEAVLIAFTVVTQEAQVWSDGDTSAPMGEVASRPHKPRDPPAIG